MATVYLDIPRKSLGQLQVLKSTDSGATWATVTGTLDSVKNQLAVDAAPTDIVILSSKAFAKQTKESTNLPVLYGEVGIGSVFATLRHHVDDGVYLSESLIGKVQTGEIAPYSQLLPFYGTRFGAGRITQAPDGGKHNDLTLPTPNNNSPAVKLLPYQVAVNNQANLNFAYNELVYNVDWGDDSTVKIVDGQSTYVNDNGDTCLYGTDQLAIPYGWVRITK